MAFLSCGGNGARRRQAACRAGVELTCARGPGCGPGPRCIKPSPVSLRTRGLVRQSEAFEQPVEQPDTQPSTGNRHDDGNERVWEIERCDGLEQPQHRRSIGHDTGD
ncbi:MAG: hypothetical protein AMJ69_02705 [Gammaproteobacteria bacterium SG8_47]|nr:MAG: hypothetical protein AMJ69_02705 [Gammaproteobacteria bacterium SG8_47]